MLKKLMITITITFLVATISIVVGVSLIMKNGVNQYITQQREYKQDVINRYFDNQFYNLFTLTKAHSYWTEAINAIDNQDNEWISQNLTTYLIDGEFNIDFVYLTNEDESYFSMVGIDQETIVNHSIYQNVLYENQESSTFLEVNEKIYLVTAVPFANDDRTGKTGAYIIGRELNETLLHDLRTFLGEIHEDHFLVSMDENVKIETEHDYITYHYDTLNESIYIAAHFEFAFVNYMTNTIQGHLLSIILVTVTISVSIIIIMVNSYRGQVRSILIDMQKINTENNEFILLEKTKSEDLNLVVDKINSLGTSIVKNIQDLIDKNIEIVNLLVVASELNDPYTKSHGDKVAKYSFEIGKRMNIKNLDQLERAARLHDIGKLFLGKDILNKPGALTHEEYVEVKTHPLKGAKLVETIKQFDNIKMGILYHHEKFNGTGYPNGLKGEEIPLFARIIAVADVYDAITSDRPYRKAFSKEKAYQIMLEGRNTLFDPDVLDVFISIIGN